MSDPSDVNPVDLLTDAKSCFAPFVSRLEVTGKDRASWLHGLCTADINALEPGQITEACITNVKGQVLAFVLVVATDDRLVLYSVANDLPDLLPHFDRYHIREDVTVVDTSSEPGPWIVTDSRAGESSADWSFGIGEGSLALVDSATNESRQALEQAIGTEEPSEPLRIAMRWPKHRVDFTDKALPQELNRPAAISFTKGCYLGQETVARLDALGHVNKQIVAVKIDSTELPDLPASLTAGDKPAGELTSAAMSPTGDGAFGLAMVRAEFATAGSELDFAGGMRATVQA